MPGRTCEVEVGQLGGLGAPRVDDDQRALGIAGDLLQRRAGARDAVGLPRVLADEQRDLGVLEVARGRWRRASWPFTQNSPVFSWASAFERYRAPSARRVAAAVGAAEVVPLPAAAVVEDRLAAVRVAHRGEAAPPPRRWRCPSRSPRTCRRRGAAAGTSAGGGRSGSGRGAAPSRTCSPARPGGPCRRGCARSAGRRRRRGAPRCRSCTRTGCRPSAASRPAAPRHRHRPPSAAVAAVRLLVHRVLDRRHGIPSVRLVTRR